MPTYNVVVTNIKPLPDGKRQVNTHVSSEDENDDKSLRLLVQADLSIGGLKIGDTLPIPFPDAE